MFGERFDSITLSLAKFTNGRKKINPPQIDRHLQEFNILIDELHKVQVIWIQLFEFSDESFLLKGFALHGFDCVEGVVIVL